MNITHPLLKEGEEYRDDWKCSRCADSTHAVIFRRHAATQSSPNWRITCLRVCLHGSLVTFAGDGDYPCPACGEIITWHASAYALSRLLKSRTRK